MRTHAFQNERQLPECLNGIDVEKGFLFLRERRDFLHGKKHTGLVVCPKQGNNGRIRANRSLQLRHVEMAVGIYRQPSDLITAPGEVFAELDRRAVLDRAGDDVAFVGIKCQCRLDGCIDRLRAAACKKNLATLAARERRHAIPRLCESRRRLATETVGAGGISIPPAQPGFHGIENLGSHLRRGIVIKIDH